MHVIEPKQLFDFCSGLEPRFTQSTIENALGLSRSALQRILNTPAFVKMSPGFCLATKDYDAWCVLAGINLPKAARLGLPTKSEVAKADSMPDFLTETTQKLSGMEISKAVELLKGAHWEKMVEALFSNKPLAERDLTEIRTSAAGLAILANYALHDERYKASPESIWESRPL